MRVVWLKGFGVSHLIIEQVSKEHSSLIPFIPAPLNESLQTHWCVHLTDQGSFRYWSSSSILDKPPRDSISQILQFTVLTKQTMCAVMWVKATSCTTLPKNVTRLFIKHTAWIKSIKGSDRKPLIGLMNQPKQKWCMVSYIWKINKLIKMHNFENAQSIENLRHSKGNSTEHALHCNISKLLN